MIIIPYFFKSFSSVNFPFKNLESEIKCVYFTVCVRVCWFFNKTKNLKKPCCQICCADYSAFFLFLKIPATKMSSRTSTYWIQTTNGLRELGWKESYRCHQWVELCF